MIVVAPLLFSLALGADVAPEPLDEQLELTRPVVDYGNVLAEETEDDTSRRIHDHFEASGVAIGLLTVPSWSGHTMREVSEAASRSFRKGFAHESPYALVVISIDDRQ